MTTPNRPKTCGALAKVSPELGDVTCKRLPRHGGEHRTALTVAAVKRAERATAKPSKARKQVRKLTVKARREAAAALAVKVEAGEITAAEALSQFSALV